MKKLAVLASFALASSAFAMDTTMNLKGRFDYLRSETETKSGAGVTTKSTSGQYQPSYLRWATGAKFNDTTSLKLTLDFTDSEDNNTNGLSNFTDEAFMTKSLGNGLSVMIGKQAVLVGGRENDISSRDIYAVSAFNDSISGNLTGLTVGYNVAGQDFYIQHLEGENTVLTDKKVTGVAWYGNLMNDMIKPIVSYHKEGTDKSGSYNTLTAVGAQVNWNMITFEGDYLMRTNEKGGTDTNGAVQDAEVTSMVFHARYNHDMYRPFVKYIMDDAEGSYSLGANFGGAVESERTVMELGLEIVPNKDEDFRYHVVYSASETEETRRTVATAAESMENKEDTKIYAGVAFGMNILK